MFWSRMLVDGALLSAVACALIFASLRANPRIWLHDFPEDLRNAVPPKTPEEQRQSLYWGIPFLAALFGAPFASTALLERQFPDAGFAALFLNAAGVVFIFNLVDLLLVDWLVLCLWTPRSLVLPGTEGMAGYKNYGHHFRGFLIGTGLSVIVGGIAAAVIRLT